MFLTPHRYIVTGPERTPFSLLPTRASTLLRDVRRRSVRRFRRGEDAGLKERLAGNV